MQFGHQRCILKEAHNKQTNKKTLDLVLQRRKHSLHFLMQQQKEWTAKTHQQNDMTIRRICRGERCAKKIAGLFEQCNAVTFVFPQ